MKRILMVTCSSSEYLIHLELARKLSRMPMIRVIFCFNAITNDLSKELENCLGEGFDLMEIFGTDRQNFSIQNALTTHEANFTEDHPRAFLRSKWHLFNHRNHAVKLFKKLLVTLDIDIVIIANNGLHFLMPYLVRASHLAKRTIIFMPDAMESLKTYQFKLESTLSLGTQKESWGRTLLCTIFRQWTFKSSNGEKMLCAPIEEIIVMKFLSAVPEYPTSPCGGRVDYLFAENNRSQIFNDLIPRKTRFIVTGSACDDILYRSLKNKFRTRHKLCVRYKLNKIRELALVVLPRFYAHPHFPNQQYKSYLDFLSAFFFSLSQICNEYNILVCIHQSTYLSQIRVCVEPYPFITLVDEHIACLLPACKLVVSCDGSTIPMVVACNIPIINYDAYKLNREAFLEEEGVTTVTNQREFLAALKKIRKNAGTIHSIPATAPNILEKCKPLDGNATTRITNQILEILNV